MTAQQTSTPGHSRRFSSSSSFGSEHYSSTPSPWKVHPSSSSPSKENNSYQNSPPPTTTTTTRPSSSLRDHLRQQQQRHQRKSDKTLKRENSGKSLVSEQQSLDDSRHEVVCQLKGKLANLYFGHQTVIEAQANGMGRKRDRRPSLQEQAKVPLGTVMGELKAHRRFSLQQSYAEEFTYEGGGGGQSKSEEEADLQQQQQHQRAPSISPEDFLTQQSIVAVLTKVAQKPSKHKQSSSSGPRSSSSSKRRLRKRVTFASTPSIAALASSSSIPVHECWWTPEELQEIHEMARQECDHYGNAKNYTKAIDTLYKANDKSQANIHRALLVLWKHRAGRGLETLIAADKKHKYVQRHRDRVLEAWDEYVHLVVTTSSSSPSSSSSSSSQQSAIDKSRRHVRRSSHTASRETTALASALANLDAEDAAVAYFEHMRRDEKQHNRHRRNQSSGAHYQSSSKKKHSRRFSSRW